jgi:Kef-type K+ transport system membrane component KefB
MIQGGNPSKYDPKSPITVFIYQAGIVIVLTRLLHFPLSKLRQPRVIAEVLTGILLGPSIMGRIPGFTDAIFPAASMPAFSVAANLGLILFLFLVGLEVDLRFLASNWRIAASVSAAGMAIPFGFGWAIAYGLYNQFRDEKGLKPIGYGTYGLFIAIALAITAFPVLCRILTSLKLLQTPVGVIVLSAGVGNDVVGWILLALCVALVNAGAGITAFYILLVAVGYILFVIYGMRPAFMWILRKSGSLQNGPTQSVVALTVLMALASAFFTGIIGIHPIFGGFIIGLMCPHEGGFAVKMTEKLEDLVSVLFLPLYFALSGLSTNLGLLDDGITWAYVVGVTAVAFFGKIIGGTFASRLNGLVWRESLTIGVMMSCKGLVELIVLNIGLQAKILSTRTFTIFVVMALVTTVATTPLTMWLYPPWYQQKLELWKKGKIDWDGNPILHDDVSTDDEAKALRGDLVANRILVYLRLDGLPGLFTLMALLGTSTRNSKQQLTNPNPSSKNRIETSLRDLRRPLQVHGVRLMELTERDSSVMKVSEIDEYANRDPVIKAFESFAHSQDIAVAGHVSVVPSNQFASTLVGRAIDVSSDMLLIPWSETGTLSEFTSLFDDYSPQAADPLANRSFVTLVAGAFSEARACHVGVFLDQAILGRVGSQSPSAENATRTLERTMTGVSLSEFRRGEMARMSMSTGHFHVVVSFSGGGDDMLAARLAMQLAENEKVNVTVVYLESAPGVPEAVADIQKIVPAAVTDRFAFVARTEKTLIAAVGAVLQGDNSEGKAVGGDAPDNLILVGRNSDSNISEGALLDASKILGSGSTGCVRMLSQMGTKASVLVVQAKLS